MTSELRLDLAALRSMYKSGEAKPTDVVAAIYDRIRSGPLAPVWISVASREKSLAKARELERDPLAPARPLYGVPFAVKDNIDAAGFATTAGCPSFAYSPAQSATVVQTLVDAGAILIGKTNMDQFATGLVGTRSPHGACSCVFDERYISGGSSSGSAVAVARGLAAFSLGTDTAGSGRVPAAFNHLIGLKPTRGLLSTAGVVPACRSLDCVSVFTHTSHDARTVFQAARGFDPADPFSRSPAPGQGAAPWTGQTVRFGIPADEELEFFGDTAAACLFQKFIETMQDLGGIRVQIDLAPFRAAAELLYSGPWVAERTAALDGFLESHGDEMDAVVRQIVSSGRRFTAVDAFEASYRLAELRRLTEAQWSRMDVMLLPTTGTIYTHEQVAADPIRLNTNLGFYTNFVNLLDLAAVAVPAGFRPNGLPFGVSLIGPAFSDEALLSLAGNFENHGSIPLGEPGLSVPGCIAIAVVGAHLAGEPLNWQLTDRGARRLRTCRTAPGYRLYALPGTMPPKPGLMRDDNFRGPGIEVEVWAVPEDQFGSFVEAVPAPLGIGNATLDSGETVKSFICEPYAVTGATEITSYGGWRSYLKQKVSIR
jgi:allophanate hydrolase